MRVPAWLCLSLILSPLPALAQDPPPPEAEEPDDDLPIVEAPTLLAPVVAEYPPAARESGQEAEVTLIVELDETGAVVEVEVTAGGSKAFDEAAVEALKAARFTPARTEAGPVGVAFEFTYAFRLDREGGVAPEDLPITKGPEILDYVEAPYPEEAKAEGIEGAVVLIISLTDEGLVEEAEVTAPAGHGFDEAALEAVKAMTFTPAQTAAGPVGVVFEFAYSFTLEPETPEASLPAPVNVTGWLRQMGTRSDVEGATIVVVGTDVVGTTGPDGRFELRGVPSGAWPLKVLHPEHVSLEQNIEVMEGELTDATLWLRSLTYRQNEAVGYYQREKQEVTRRTLTIDEVKRIPGTFGDPVKVIQTLPGAARSPFGTGFLIIRGANPLDSAVYIDGIRVPIIYHLTGTTSVLSPEIVGAVDYLPGGYSTHFGRSMAGVVDVRTKEEFGEPKVVIGADALDAQVWFQGQLGKNKQHGLAFGARRSYIDALLPLFTRGTDFVIQPRYWDYQLKWVPTLDAKNKLSVFIYGFQDLLDIGTPDDVAQGTDQDTQGDFRRRYQSHRITTRWRHEFSDTFKLDLSPSFGFDLIEFGLGNEFKVATDTWLVQLRAEAPWRPHPAIEVVPGLDFIGGPWGFDFKSPFRFEDLNDPLAERDSVGFDGKGTAWSPDAYLNLNVRPLDDRDRWLITPGVRFNSVTFTYGGSINQGIDVGNSTIWGMDGRLATRAVLFQDETSSGTIKASSGLYNQPPQPFQSVGLGTGIDLLPERAWNSSLGFEHQVTPSISWDLDIFYRQMDQLIEFDDAFSGFGDQAFNNAGLGRAYGFELLLRHADTGPFFGWISYTFSRSFRKDDADDDWYPFDFDQPHILSAQGGYNLPFDIGISAQIQVVSGNPETPFDASIFDVDGNFHNGFATGEPNSVRLPTFVQTSFRVDKTWTFRTWQLETYIDFINAIRGVNPEATLYNYDFSESAYVRGLPFIPNLGVEVRFWP